MSSNDPQSSDGTPIGSSAKFAEGSSSHPLAEDPLMGDSHPLAEGPLMGDSHLAEGSSSPRHLAEGSPAEEGSGVDSKSDKPKPHVLYWSGPSAVLDEPGVWTHPFGPGIVSDPDGDSVLSASLKLGGSGRGGNENQDRLTVMFVVLPNGKLVKVICMADGHGPDGLKYANQITQNLPFRVLEQMDKVLTNSECLKDIFITFDAWLQGETRFLSGGATCTVVILTEGRVISANIGDCDAVIFSPSSVSSWDLKCVQDGQPMVVGQDGRMMPIGSGAEAEIDRSTQVSAPIRLTPSQGVDNLEEVLRVVRTGASLLWFQPGIRTPAFEKVYGPDGTVTGVKKLPVPHGTTVITASGDPGVYIHNPPEDPSSTCLNVSRRFGSKGPRWTSAIPSVADFTYPVGTDLMCLVATDGFFNCLRRSGPVDELATAFNCGVEGILDYFLSAVDKTFGRRNADNASFTLCRLT